jgi:hypothetical protein
MMQRVVYCPECGEAVEVFPEVENVKTFWGQTRRELVVSFHDSYIEHECSLEKRK